MAERNGDAKGGGGVQINLELYGKRLKLLNNKWKEHKKEMWGGADAIAVVTPPASEDLRYLKSTALHIWLLGYEFPETVMVFMPGALHFVCSSKKAGHLEDLQKSSKMLTGVDIHIHVKERKQDGSSQMTAVLESVKGSSKSKSPVIGVLSREATEGPLMEKWAECLDVSGSATVDVSGSATVDVSGGFSEIFAVKDEEELSNIKNASQLSAAVLKLFVVPKLEVIIDEEKKVTHAELMENTENVITNPGKYVKLKGEDVDICYPPVFQSGGIFDLKPSAVSNEEPLYYDALGVILCAIGARFRSYCSNVARSIMIDADKTQEKAYKILLKAHEAAIGALRPGSAMSAAYKAAYAVVESGGSEFLPYFTKNAGTGIGIEFRESGLTLNGKNDRVIRAGMVFNVSLGFHNLSTESRHPKSKTFSLLLADTAIVLEKGAPEVPTLKCSKTYTDIAYSFKDDEEEEEVKVESKPKVKSEPNGSSEPAVRMATLRSDNQEMTKEEQRRQHQAELARQKNEETARRLASGGLGSGEGQGPNKSTGDIVAYRNVDDIPARELKIHVDQKNEAVLLPIYGLLVPFHIATVKSVTSQQDGGHSYIRIIFNVPGAGFGPNDVPTKKFPASIYVKEVSFRSNDTRHSYQVVQLIKTLRRQVAQRESERAERATLVTQERLQTAKGRPIRLSDLWIRPAFGGRGRKMSGTLEAHTNGLRYSTMRQEEKVDVMYRNIKHAFFQPAEKEMITLVHFHLHNYIMVGTKKTKDVQFYVEVMEVVQTLGGNRRSMMDPDEIEEEQQERDRRNKINKEFEAFVKRMAELWDQPPWRELDLEFDIPFRELGFHGVPNKSSAFIVPTVNCLVELIETPFLVVSLNDIEIVNLERVGLGQKAFDMAIVFKDFKRDILRIDAIPSTSLDGIKEWLNSMNIKYYESRMNLNWRPILKTILEDPDKFIEDGGWEFLNMEASDSDSEKSEESDEGYEPSDVEVVSESEDDDSDDESVVESDDDEEEEAEDSEEEEGLTWDQLEEKAKREDKMNGEEEDSEDDRHRNRKKVSGKSRMPDPRDSKRGMPNKRPKVR